MTVYPYRRKGLTRYRYDFTLMGRRYTKAGFAAKIEARDAEGVQRQLVRAGHLVAFSTFQTLVDAYLLASARHKTAEWVYQLTRKLNKGFGHLAPLPPAEITPAHVEVALQRIQQRGNGPRSVNEYRKIMSAVMKFAVDREAIRRNPVAVIERMPEPDEQVPPIPTPHLKTLVRKAEPAFAAYLLVLSQTAARYIEVARAEWTDVDPDAVPPVVYLTTRKRRRGDAKRIAQPLTPVALRAIESMRGQHPRWVFPGPRGDRALSYRTALKRLHALCDACELPHYGFHQLRHWAGFVASQAGKNKKAVAKLLRHANTAATERYLHAIDPELWEIAVALEAAVTETQKEQQG